MLAALVLAGIVAAPVGTAGLLIRGRGRGRTSGTWPAVRRFAWAIGGTVLLAALVVAALRLLGDSEHYAIDGAAGLVVASLVWLPVTRTVSDWPCPPPSGLTLTIAAGPAVTLKSVGLETICAPVVTVRLT